MTEFVTFDHAPDSKRYFVVRRPGIAVSLTAVIVPADSPLPPAVTYVVAPDGCRLVADCITVHRPGDDRECPALPGGCDGLGEAMPGAARLLREWAADACQPHSIADALVDILHRETGEAGTPTDQDARQTKPANDKLIADLRTTLGAVAFHQHPILAVDFFCLELVAHMGERMGPVLSRLHDVELERDRLRAEAEELREANRRLCAELAAKADA